MKRVEIPKPGGGVRKLGILTVLDRFIQQALLQVLQPAWDGTFAEGRYGFRPGRSAHPAITQAQKYLDAGYIWVVDLDLEKFFDRVNHDKLMSLVKARITDRRVLQLIDRYLKAGALTGDGFAAMLEGTPQGGPPVSAKRRCGTASSRIALTAEEVSTGGATGGDAPSSQGSGESPGRCGRGAGARSVSGTRSAAAAMSTPWRAVWMSREGEAPTCRAQARQGAHDRGGLTEEPCEVAPLMHGFAAEAGGAMRSSTVTRRGNSGASWLGGPVNSRGWFSPHR